MKTTIITIVLALFVTLAFSVSAEAQGLSRENTIVYKKLAVDSALSNSTDKVSLTQTMFSKGATSTAFVNFFKGARALVTAKQTNDSIRGHLYMLVGQITNGTAGSTYDTVFVDSVYRGKGAINVDLSAYTLFPEIKFIMRGQSFGNGYLAKWSIIFGGQGEVATKQEPY